MRYFYLLFIVVLVSGVFPPRSPIEPNPYDDIDDVINPSINTRMNNARAHHGRGRPVTAPVKNQPDTTTGEVVEEEKMVSECRGRIHLIIKEILDIPIGYSSSSFSCRACSSVSCNPFAPHIQLPESNNRGLSTKYTFLGTENIYTGRIECNMFNNNIKNHGFEKIMSEIPANRTLTTSTIEPTITVRYSMQRLRCAPGYHNDVPTGDTGVIQGSLTTDLNNPRNTALR